MSILNLKIFYKIRKKFMKIKLFNDKFKRKNSTKKWDLTLGKDYEGYLREGCSILNPVITFESVDKYTTRGNWAYIEEYGRYYFIDDWYTEQGLWTASMSVDVLASCRYSILRTQQYVTRSATNKNGYLIDTIYPISTKTNIYQYTPKNDSIRFGYTSYTYSEFCTKSFSDGYVLVGVSGGASSATGIDYYLMPADGKGLGKLISGLYDISPSDFGDNIGTGLAKQLANPIQYIVSCYWYPAVPSAGRGGGTSTIPLGYYSVSGVTAAKLDPVDISQVVNYVDFVYDAHYQASSRGNYLNYAPYSKYILKFLPFGFIELDSTMFGDGDTIRVEFRNDVTNGRCEYTILGKRNSGEATPSIAVFKGACQSGVSITFMQRSSDIVGSMGSILGGAAQLFTGNVLGAVSSIANGVAAGNTPKTNGSSSISGAINWDLSPCLQIQRYEPEGDAYDKVGYPFCEDVTLNTLKGYTKCEKASIENLYITDDEGIVTGAVTQPEYEMIINYLEDGFYIE